MVTRQEAKDESFAFIRATNLLNAVKNGKLLTLIVEPTSKCNLSCTFCDMHSGRIPAAKKYIQNMEQSTWYTLIHQLQQLDYRLKQLQVHGGGNRYSIRIF